MFKMNLAGLLVIIGVTAFGALVIFVIVPFRLKRAMKKLIKTFREQDATSDKNAVTYKELRISVPGFFSFRFYRDYKYDALNLLVRAEIVKITEDKKFFLSEERFKESKIYTPP